jgi:hypothetical protein
MTRIALSVALLLGCCSALAESDAVKKTTDGVGNLFRGMGQEINKLGGTLTNGSKKDGKRADPAKKPEEKKN